VDWIHLAQDKVQ